MPVMVSVEATVAAMPVPAAVPPAVEAKVPPAVPAAMQAAAAMPHLEREGRRGLSETGRGGGGRAGDARQGEREPEGEGRNDQAKAHDGDLRGLMRTDGANRRAQRDSRLRRSVSLGAVGR